MRIAEPIWMSKEKTFRWFSTCRNVSADFFLSLSPMASLELRKWLELMSFCDNKQLKVIQDVYFAAVISKITVEKIDKVKRNGFNHDRFIGFYVQFVWVDAVALNKDRCKIHNLLYFFFVSTLTELPKVANCTSANKFHSKD